MPSLKRRRFLQHGLTSLLLSASPSLYAKVVQQTSTIPSNRDNNANIMDAQQTLSGWFSAQGAQQTSYGFAASFQHNNKIGQANNPSETVLKRVTGLSGFRGHGAAQHPNKPFTVIMFGRRPSTQAIEINLLSGEVTQSFATEKDRHFFGHGAFSADGQWLFTTEADLDNNVGVIGIRDASSYKKVGEYSSYGVGPHQIMLMPDGLHLVVANGGILTRPETGRKKLNLDTMRSSLSYLDVNSGELHSEWFVAEPKASIRHIDVAVDSQGQQTVALAMQVQRTACGHENTVSLAGLHKFNAEHSQPIQLLEHELVMPHMNDYIGSVAVNPNSNIAGFTSPRGDIVGFWDINNGEFKGYHAMRDVCGIAVAENQSSFLVTNSYGMVHSIDAHSLQERVENRKHYNNLAWDNHMLSLKL